MSLTREEIGTSRKVLIDWRNYLRESKHELERRWRNYYDNLDAKSKHNLTKYYVLSGITEAVGNLLLAGGVGEGNAFARVYKFGECGWTDLRPAREIMSQMKTISRRVSGRVGGYTAHWNTLGRAAAKHAFETAGTTTVLYTIPSVGLPTSNSAERHNLKFGEGIREEYWGEVDRVEAVMRGIVEDPGFHNLPEALATFFEVIDLPGWAGRTIVRRGEVFEAGFDRESEAFARHYAATMNTINRQLRKSDEALTALQALEIAREVRSRPRS